MIDYKYAGETFKLDDSKGCYVEVTHDGLRGLTGYFGVNISVTATDQYPYSYRVNEGSVTPNGIINGIQNPSFKDARDEICEILLNRFRTQEAAKTFDRAKYCAELHDAVKNLS